MFKRLKKENEYSIFENEEIYEDMINSVINLMRNENINICLEEIDINNNLNSEQQEDNVPENKEIIITKELNYLDEICNIDIILEQNDKFDNDFVFLPKDSCLFCQDEFSSETKFNLLMKIGIHLGLN